MGGLIFSLNIFNELLKVTLHNIWLLIVLLCHSALSGNERKRLINLKSLPLSLLLVVTVVVDGDVLLRAAQLRQSILRKTSNSRIRRIRGVIVVTA